MGPLALEAVKRNNDFGLYDMGICKYIKMFTMRQVPTLKLCVHLLFFIIYKYVYISASLRRCFCVGSVGVV